MSEKRFSLMPLNQGYFEQQIANNCKKILHAMSIKEAAKSLLKRAVGVLKGFTITYNLQDA